MVQCVGGRSGFWLFLAAVIWFLVNIDVIFLFFIGLFGGCFWNSGILVSLPVASTLHGCGKPVMKNIEQRPDRVSFIPWNCLYFTTVEL